MIVYNENNYSFLNYKDSVSPLTTYFKINEIEIGLVETPALGTDYILIYKEGKTLSSGSPCAGGTIFLQNNYVAIAYDQNKTAFKLAYSKGYRYTSCYEQLLPTKHLSTPFARSVMENPLSIALLPKGCIAIYNNVPFMGTEADYIAMEDGDVLAYYGVKSHTYFGTPMPSEWDDFSICALGKKICEDPIASLYTVVPETPGLVANGSLKTRLSEWRQAMYNYKRMDIDYTLAKAFMAPVTSAARYNAVVNSALNPDNAKLLIREKRESSQDVSTLLHSVVFDEVAFMHLISYGFSSDTLLDYVEQGNIPPTAIVLLNSDFQALLDQYNIIYERERERSHAAALKTMRSSLQLLQNNINSFLPTDMAEEVQKHFRGLDGFANATLTLKTGVSVVIGAIETINQLPLDRLTDDGANAELFAQNAVDIIKQYSLDVQLDESKIEQALATQNMDEVDFFNPNIVITDRFKSVNYARAWSAVVEVVMAKVRDITSFSPFSVHVEVDNGTTRWCNPFVNSMMIDLLNTSASWRVQTAELYQDKMLFTAVIDIPEYDSWVHYYESDMANGLKNAVRGFLADKGMMDVNFGSLRFHNKGWTICHLSQSKQRYIKCQPNKNTCSSITLDVTFSYPIGINMENLSLVAITKDGEVDYTAPVGFEVNVANSVAIAKSNSQKYNSLVNTYAANVAFEVLKPLFANLKEVFEFNAIGSLGTTYDGVAVSINDLSKLGFVDQAYIQNLIKLIDGIPSEDQKLALQAFRTQLTQVSASFTSTEPIYYLTKEDCLKGEGVTDTAAIGHYLLGAFRI